RATQTAPSPATRWLTCSPTNVLPSAVVDAGDTCQTSPEVDFVAQTEPSPKATATDTGSAEAGAPICAVPVSTFVFASMRETPFASDTQTAPLPTASELTPRPSSITTTRPEDGSTRSTSPRSVVTSQTAP